MSVEGVKNSPKNKSRKAESGGAHYEISIYVNSNILRAHVTKIGNGAK